MLLNSVIDADMMLFNYSCANVTALYHTPFSYCTIAIDGLLSVAAVCGNALLVAVLIKTSLIAVSDILVFIDFVFYRPQFA